MTVSSWADSQIHASRILRLEESRDAVVQRLDGALNMIGGLAEGQRRLETRMGEVLAAQHRFTHCQQRLENQVADLYGEVTALRIQHKRNLGQLKAEMTGLKSEVTELRSEVTEVKSDMAGLRSEVTEVKSEMAGLRSEMAEVKSDVAGLKSDVAELKSDVAELRAGQARLASELVGARFGLANMRAEMQRQAGVLDRILAAVTSGGFVAHAP